MILIINTSLDGIELVLGDKYKKIEVQKQSSALSAQVESILMENNITWKNLEAVGVITGPGSFTGIRIGIAYAKGLGIGLGIPVIPVNSFEIYLYENPDAFVAINSGRADLFVAAHNLEPSIMSIEEVEKFQMNYPKTVGHKPYSLFDAMELVKEKIQSGKKHHIIPLYIRQSYAELAQDKK